MIEGLSLGRTSRVERVLSLLVESGLVYCVLWVRVEYDDLSITPSSRECERELTANRLLLLHTKSVGRSKIPPIQTRRPDSRRRLLPPRMSHPVCCKFSFNVCHLELTPS